MTRNDAASDGSTSTAEEDVMASDASQADCYLSTPVELDDFETLVKNINEFWLGKAELPQTA